MTRDTPLFHHLRNEWFLEEGPQPGTTKVNFGIDFAFRSALYQHVTDLFFNEVVRHMVSAFEKRCAYVRRQREELGRFPLEDSIQSATTTTPSPSSSSSMSNSGPAAAESPSKSTSPSTSRSATPNPREQDQRLTVEQVEEEEMQWEAAWDDVARRARRPPPLPSRGIWE